MRGKILHKQNSGFTLVETLAAVAILVVLLGISAVAVLCFQKQLEITRLDNAARGIYMAAQNRAVLLSGGKQLKGLVKGEGNAVALAARAAGEEEQNLYYIAHTAEKTDPSLERLLTTGSIDPALRQGEFYIVYEPVSGSVTDVFYVDGELEKLVAGDFAAFYRDWSTAPRSERMKAVPMLGRYSGGMAEGEDIDTAATPTLTVMIKNEERLTVTVSRWVPDAIGRDKAKLAVTLQYGGETVTLYDDGAETKDPFFERAEASESAEGKGKNYTRTWVLDELGDRRFAGLFPGRTMDLGEIFTVEASLTSADGSFSQITAQDDDNSLFARESSGSDTAYLEYLRHLQNLDTGFSGVGADKDKAVQMAEIRCASNETYPNYKFRPITNNSLTSFDGREFAIRDLYVSETGDAPAGLFAKAQGRKATDLFAFRNVRLVNAGVETGTGAAGALAGQAFYASFDGCWVYWEPEEGELNLRSLLGSDTDEAGYRYRIRGAKAGGLVGGMTTGTMTNCLAAATVQGSSTAGGLVGSVEAGGQVTVQNSYADCYLTGNSNAACSAAGLIGDLSGTAGLENCYAAGFIVTGGNTKMTTAGLCLGSGKTTSKNVYSVLCSVGTNGSITYPPLTGNTGDSLTNTYRRGGNSADSKTYEEMTGKDFGMLLGNAFAWKTGQSSSPYNLRERLNLVVYSFPGLAALPHYGDWNAEFKKPSLVYYEEYAGSDGKSSYGFSGGNARYLIGELSDKETILLDGYAVALLQDDLKTDEVEVTYNYFDPADGTLVVPPVTKTYAKPGKGGGTTPELIPTTWKNSEGNEADYYLAPLPEELVNSKTADGKIYRYLNFSFMPGTGEEEARGEYFYSPHFAETVVPYQAESGSSYWTAVGNNETWTKYTEELEKYHGELADARHTLGLRTPRHLYSLGKFPEYHHNEAHSLTFRQELDLNYGSYTGYGLFETKTADGAFRQEPIGRFDLDQSFLGTYNGGCHTISGVVFDVPKGSTRSYAGLFGFSEGTLRGIVYKMDPDAQVKVEMENGSARLYIGGLVGRSDGTVQNCAVSGASFTGYNSGSRMYIGGLVGRNQGILENCGAEAALLASDNYSYAETYMGGAVGENTGTIRNTYSVGRLTATVDETVKEVRICGFAGYNSGSISDSYAATDLRSSGRKVETYGFCGRREGTQTGTYYLNQGNFTYRGTSYNADYTPRKASPLPYGTLAGTPSAVKGMSKIEKSGEFPYPTAVKDADGEPIHYGEWPDPMDLGEMGAYYWEKLTKDGKDAYYIQLLAVDSQKTEENKISRLTTLSNAHDDGGVVTGYGYGYYEKDGTTVGASGGSLYYADGSGKNTVPFTADIPSETTVNDALAVLMPGYTFRSYHTYIPDSAKAGLYPENKPDHPNASLTLTQGSFSVTFAVNPHFAGALAVEKAPGGWTVAKELESIPGTEENPYGVRSVEQLEFINWNTSGKNTRTVIQAGQKGGDMGYFPYLTSSRNRKAGKLYWLQSHDLNGNSKEYTPIAEYYDNTGGDTGDLYGWFGGSYNGADYVIENVSIQGQQSSCAGLFGIVYGGTLENMILHDSKGTGFINSGYYKGITSDSRWYAIGALAGLAAADGDGNGNGKVENCAVSGYTINAKVYTAGGWGGSGIGGLLGISRMELKNCSAVTNIDVPDGTQNNDNMRVGGLAGICQKSITNCYAGGSITIDANVSVKKPDNETVFPKGAYIGGIVGGSYMKPLRVGGDNSELIGRQTGNDTDNALANCYSFVELPGVTDRDGKKANPYIRALYALGGTGDVYTVFEDDSIDKKHHVGNRGTCTITNCYYYKDTVLKNNGGKAENIRKQRPTDDPLAFKTDLFQTNGIDHSDPSKDNTTKNPNVTELTYRQLAGLELVDGKSIYTLLPDFHRVTTEVEGLSVSGKYSYPPSKRAELAGLDYPFPTILTKDQGSYRVHYGEWPVYGITRPQGGQPITLDLFTAAPHTETLGLAVVQPGGKWSVATDPKDQTAVDVQIGEDTGTLTVTPQNVGTTKLVITYTKDGTAHSFTLTANVTTELELRPNTVRLFKGGTTTVPVTPYSGGNALPLSSLELTAAVCDEVICQVSQAKEDGTKKPAITFTGGAPCEAMAHISFTCTTVGGSPIQGLSPIAITVLPLPEAEKGTGGDWQIDFGAYDVSNLGAVLRGTADPPPAKVTASDKKITLSDIGAGVTEIPLEITLTMEGRSHTIQMTAKVG